MTTRRPRRETAPPNAHSVRVENDALCFGEGLRVSFQRTLRIPDDGRRYPLPPGLGRFPLRRVDDHAGRVPSGWRAHGGVFLPLYQREALWICFEGEAWPPRALQVGVGRVCALTGRPWSEALSADPQDYLVTPPQPWLDGIVTESGSIRQFVAMPLDLGYTVEGQVSGEERHGGLQLRVFEPRAGRFGRRPRRPRRERWAAEGGVVCASMCPAAQPLRAGALGLSAGGRMAQEVYPDPYGIDTWDPERSARIFVHLVNSELWREITGEPPPPTPVTAREYANCGLPWFELYDEGYGALPARESLARVKSVKEIDGERSDVPLQDDGPVDARPTRIPVHPRGADVRDGDW